MSDNIGEDVAEAIDRLTCGIMLLGLIALLLVFT